MYSAFSIVVTLYLPILAQGTLAGPDTTPSFFQCNSRAQCVQANDVSVSLFTVSGVALRKMGSPLEWIVPTPISCRISAVLLTDTALFLGCSHGSALRFDLDTRRSMIFKQSINRNGAITAMSTYSDKDGDIMVVAIPEESIAFVYDVHTGSVVRSLDLDRSLPSVDAISAQTRTSFVFTSFGWGDILVDVGVVPHSIRRERDPWLLIRGHRACRAGPNGVRGSRPVAVVPGRCLIAWAREGSSTMVITEGTKIRAEVRHSFALHAAMARRYIIMQEGPIGMDGPVTVGIVEGPSTEFYPVPDGSEGSYPFPEDSHEAGALTGVFPFPRPPLGSLLLLVPLEAVVIGFFVSRAVDMWVPPPPLLPEAKLFVPPPSLWHLPSSYYPTP